MTDMQTTSTNERQQSQHRTCKQSSKLEILEILEVTILSVRGMMGSVCVCGGGGVPVDLYMGWGRA